MLLIKTNEYVLLRQVTNDPIKEQFGKFQPSVGSGQCSGTYLITVRKIEQRFRIDNAQKYILTSKNLDLPPTNHDCPLCIVKIEVEIIEAEVGMPLNVCQALVFIDDYITTKFK